MAGGCSLDEAANRVGIYLFDEAAIRVCEGIWFIVGTDLVVYNCPPPWRSHWGGGI